MPAQALPGVRVGPLDPDRGETYGMVAGSNVARRLIRHVADAHPQELIRVLNLKFDPERSKTLDLDEVRDKVDLPEGAEEIVGANVRGERDRTQYVTYTFTSKTGRTGKWFAEYDPKVFKHSVKAGDEAVRVAELKAAGLPWDLKGGDTDFHTGGAQTEALRRENAAAQRRIEELEERLEAVGGDASETPPEPPPGAAATGEPFEGYDDLNASELRKRLKDEDTTDEERQAVLAYEQANANRKTVVGAAQQKLGPAKS